MLLINKNDLSLFWSQYKKPTTIAAADLVVLSPSYLLNEVLHILKNYSYYGNGGGG